MGTQLPTERGTAAPIFGPWLLWPNGWMTKIKLGMDVGLGPGHTVIGGEPAPPIKLLANVPMPHTAVNGTSRFRWAPSAYNIGP